MTLRPIYIYVTPFFPEPGRHFGSYGYDFVQAVKRNSDYDVRVFVPGDGPDYDFEGCHVYRFPIRNLPSMILPMLCARFNAKSFLEKVREVGIDLNQVAVCHGNTSQFCIYPLAIKKLNRSCKTVMHHHHLASIGLGIGRLRHFWPHKVLCYLWLRRLFEQMDLHVFISKACQRSFTVFPDTSWSVFADYRKLGRGMRWFRSVRVKDYTILWNGVDTKVFFPHRNTSSRDFTIGCIGNFVEVKDHIGLVRAVHALVTCIPNIRLELLGDNGYAQYREPVKRYITENGLEAHVRFLPHLEHSQLAEVYNRWDLFVLPSFFEGLGCVYLEAWACGTPFIGCRGNGIEDCIREEDRDKWLVAPLDVDGLVKTIEDFHRDRPQQVLSAPIDIDDLVTNYLSYLEGVAA